MPFLNDSLQLIFYTFLGIFVLVVVLIMTVLLMGLLQYKNLKHRKIWAQIIDTQVSEAIVYGTEDTVNEDFDQYALNTSFRNLFLEKLVASEKKFSGMAQNEIRELFDGYDLKKEALRKLNQKKAYLIAGGIQELTAMKVEEVLPKMESFLSHNAPQVYQEAQYAVVSFKGFEGLEFLNYEVNKISEWQQLRLLLSIHQIPENCDAEVKAWLESSNESVIIFTLGLLRKFQMLSFYAEVFQLLDSSSDEVRIQAVRTLQALENGYTVLDLIKIFEHQIPDVQLEIIKTLKFLKDHRSLEFLKKQLLFNDSTGIRILAAEALCFLEQEVYLRNIADNESSPPLLVRVIKHALQEKIC